MNSPDYHTRERASNELRDLLLRYITDRNYEGFKALVDKLRLAAQSPNPEVRTRAEAILNFARTYVDMYVAGF